MQPPYRPWQPWRGLLALVVILAMGIATFSIFNPLDWIIRVSEVNMLLAIYLVFLIFLMHGYQRGWIERMFAPPYIGWLGRRYAPYRRWVRALILTGVMAALTAATYPIIRLTVGPSFPWMLFFEIQTLFVFLHIALIFGNWPLQRFKQPFQGIGLLIISYVVSTILYLALHNYSEFYLSAQAVPPQVLAVLLPPGTTPEYLAAINPNGMAEAFYMATMNTMFILYLCIFYFLFDMWPFRLLKKQPLIGITASIVVVSLSVLTWQLALIVYPKMVTVNLGLLTGGATTGLAPLSALPIPAQINLTMLHVLGAFEGPLIFGVLTIAAVFLWWPTTAMCRGGRGPFNRQPIKGLILMGLAVVIATGSFFGLSSFGYLLMPAEAWTVPGLIPAPFLLFLWLVICFLPGLSAYVVYYAAACESWPQPPLPPPHPDYLLYKTVKAPTVLLEKRKNELKEKFVY